MPLNILLQKPLIRVYKWQCSYTELTCRTHEHRCVNTEYPSLTAPEMKLFLSTNCMTRCALKTHGLAKINWNQPRHYNQRQSQNFAPRYYHDIRTVHSVL